eukprot:3934015-Rhodomonas_salina.1
MDSNKQYRANRIILGCSGPAAERWCPHRVIRTLAPPNPQVWQQGSSLACPAQAAAFASAGQSVRARMPLYDYKPDYCSFAVTENQTVKSLGISSTLP